MGRTPVPSSFPWPAIGEETILADHKLQTLVAPSVGGVSQIKLVASLGRGVCGASLSRHITYADSSAVLGVAEFSSLVRLDIFAKLETVSGASSTALRSKKAHPCPEISLLSCQ
ncbi:MAG: hypothetical protein LQ340_006695 [Diploschistes diacapsis]|nr:MAG: hypothetical protein LQ340_006695 [Diploschistes diacapsis]